MFHQPVVPHLRPAVVAVSVATTLKSWLRPSDKRWLPTEVKKRGVLVGMQKAGDGFGTIRDVEQAAFDLLVIILFDETDNVVAARLIAR